MRAGAQPQRILTVSELTLLVRDRLEQEFPDVWIEGEISTLRSPASGHLYFILKDAQSQIRTVLFRNQAQRLRFALREGLQVVVRGRLTVYEPRGEYQVVVDYLEPKGVGALQLALEQLKERLAREGLFDESRKRPLPFLPRRVGLVTSLSGAAIRDMLVVLGRRCPSLDVLICPVPVQGEGAAPKIAAAIRTLSASGKVDVMIVGRGGGSLEDLWCFNEEVVVRAIAASKVPVVSAVGHEIDVTLADFAADYRAPTPSAAAEAVAPVSADLVRAATDLRARLERTMGTRLAMIRHRVEASRRIVLRLILPVQRQAQRLDDLSDRLSQSLHGSLVRLGQRLVAARHRLGLASPAGLVRASLVLAPQYMKRLEQEVRSRLRLRRQAVRSLLGTLDGLSPLAVLARGYSIVQTVPAGLVVKRAEDVKVGDQLRAKLASGQLLCVVREVSPDS
ncbi:MAG: exodeoxyribonuclease VII large subunit [Nitrospirota bacterium]|nr:exodeoxyribonuclease VII large subunit [Nitrospirota bacterium]MDE3242023.1 exodeoxyribonuclease VII large subunit [Nitrospirota bacterium]